MARRVQRFDHFDPIDSFDFRFLDDSCSSAEIEAACKYEYMRESRSLRRGIDRPGSPGPSHLPELTVFQLFRLFVALKKTGFPKPWKKLGRVSKSLIPLLIDSSEKTIWGQKAAEHSRSHPALTIESMSVELAGEGETIDEPFRWRLAPAEPQLLRRLEQSRRNYFFGIIRIDEAYNATQLQRAFTDWLSKHYPRTPSGGGPQWRDRLNQLAVMRIVNSQSDKWKRLKMVAEFCGYKGCKDEWAAYTHRCKQGRGDEPMANSARVEISSARREARKYFRTLFPSEEPLSWRTSMVNGNGKPGSG